MDRLRSENRLKKKVVCGLAGSAFLLAGCGSEPNCSQQESFSTPITFLNKDGDDVVLTFDYGQTFSELGKMPKAITLAVYPLGTEPSDIFSQEKSQVVTKFILHSPDYSGDISVSGDEVGVIADPVSRTMQFDVCN